MVPSSRFLLFTTVVGLPLFLLAGMDTDQAGLWMAALGTLGVVALLDLALSINRLEGLGVECGKVQRLIQDQEGPLEFFINNPSKSSRRIRIGWPFPRSMQSPYSDLWVKLPAGVVKSRLLWPVTSKERGQVLFDRSYLESPSYLGLWDVRKSVPSAMEVRVYPNLSSERKGLAALFLNRGGYGVHAQRQVGKGREFDKLREYMHGDSYSDIHWKATARRNHPITKIFQIEKTQEVYVVVDASRLSGRPAFAQASGFAKASPDRSVGRPATVGTLVNKGGENLTQDPDSKAQAGRRVTLLERFLTAALVLRVAAEKQGDLFGLITFSDKVHGFLPAKNGRAHYNACRDMLYTLYPRQVTPDFDELFTTIRLKMRRRALLFFLTSLDDPLLAEQFTKNVNLISRQHLVMVNMIAPEGARPLFDEPEEGVNADVYERLGGHMFWHRLKELERVLKSRGVTFSMLSNENFSAELVTQYINLKQRQIL